MRKSRLIAILLVLVMVVSLTATSGSAEGKFTPGTYEAVALGRSGDVTVRVEMTEDEIANIEVIDHMETEGIGTKAIDVIPGKIIQAQSLEINAVAGATVTTDAIIAGVKDCIEQAGGTVEDLKNIGIEQTETEVVELAADVVVVGGGASGLSAAVEAAQSGLSVIVLEKRDMVGGMAAGIEGVFGYGSRMQEEANVEMPPLYELVDEEMEYTNYRSDAVVWRNLFANSGENIDWLQDMGVEFTEVGSYSGVSSFLCFHWFPTGSCGATYVEAMTNELAKYDTTTILTGTPAFELTTNDAGDVTGVRALNSEENKEYRIAAKGVILCTGGLASNHPLMEELTGDDQTYVLSISGSIGDGYMMAEAVGAGHNKVCALQWPYVYGYNVSDDRTNDLFTTAGYQGLPIINQDGVRFFSEDVYERYFTALFMNALSSQKANYTLIDPNTIDRLESGEGCINGFVFFCTPGGHQPYLRAQLEEATMDGNGQVLKGETLEELAMKIGCDPEVLQNTVDRYNGFVEKGVDEDYGKDPKYLFEISSEGPYYAVINSRCYVTSVGGIDIDASNRVLDTEGKPIKGLYSAGVDSSELYQETYNYQLSGGMMAYNVYSGRNSIRTLIYDLSK